MKVGLDETLWAETRSTLDRDLQELLIAAIPKLRAFARMMADDTDFADDLVHQTLRQGWMQRPQAPSDRSSTLWLFQILRTLYYSDPRRAGVLAASAKRSHPPADDDISMLQRTHVRLALAKLSEQHREVLILVGASGFDYEDVAQVIGCPLGTVKSRLARARRALDGILSEWSEPAAEEDDGHDEGEARMPSKGIH